MSWLLETLSTHKGAVLAAAGVCTGIWMAMRVASRKARQEFQLRARIPASKSDVFELHVDPARFYRVLEFKTTGDKGYRVIAVHESADRTLLSYALEHKSAFGTVRSTPLRFDIERFGDAPGFKETFSVLGTDLLFRWRFRDAPDGSGGTDVALDIQVEGPAWAVRFFSRVEGDFQARFDVTRRHIHDLIPKDQQR
jgi:hypothetical protein